MKNNHCPLIFHNIYIERFGNGRHSVSPCCLAKLSEPDSSPIDFNNNPHLNKIRESNKNNNKPSECSACWELEDLGGISRRLKETEWYNSAYNKKLDLILDKIPVYSENKLHGLDYNTLPICNAKCVICGPQYSSTWAADVGVSLKAIVSNNYNHLNGLDLGNLKTLYFNGGEPLLTDEHLTVLKKINNITRVVISYNTNGSCYPSNEVLDIWNQAKLVNITFSIDGIKDRFEKTRAPLKWDNVSANIEKMNNLSNINIRCSYTIGRHNVYDLQDTINWFSQLPNFDIFSQFGVYYVDKGHHLDLHHAPADQKQEFKKELQKFDQFSWHNGIINAVST